MTTTTSPARTMRCAIYTRKSTDEGLDQQFNSLDAQRESAEAYIASQQHEGWVGLPEHYDDGGFTGGNMERPALKRLLADISAGKVDCVTVYKVDRLSRSLLDFARMMEVFDRHGVSFVSVTQQFNTSTSMGRLILNVLLSFAQFEREMISERTRDKMSAARRKGRRVGGVPLLGYDVDPQTKQLVVNEREAAQVREIFQLYLQHEALLPTVRELESRGWRNKLWKTHSGTLRGGKLFNKTSLHKLLTNVTYTGRVCYRDELLPGAQAAILPDSTWKKVQNVLRRNGRNGGVIVRNKYGAILKGLLRCGPCDCAMTPSYSQGRHGGKRYHYYVCSQAQKNGRGTCPSRSIPAGEVEQFVVDQIRGIGRDPRLVRETLRRSQALIDQAMDALATEQRQLQDQVIRWQAEMREFLEKTPNAAAELADLADRIACSDRRLLKLRQQVARLARQRIDESLVAGALAEFEPVWESLTPREQARLLRLLVQRVEYNGATGKIAIVFHSAGIQTLAGQFPETPR